MDRRAAGLILVSSLLMAGCASSAREPAKPMADAVEALADTPPMDWSAGNWWSYRASVQNVTFDIALIVHETRADGFRLGSNLSAGFFGLPWSGNVTGDLNPRIGPEEWPLFRFPLEDGKSWSYRLLGHDATTSARAGLFHVPGVGPRPGFAMEAKAYGQTFARYNYVPEVGWFTRLQLVEPTNGQTVLTAELTSFGPDWQEAYYVEELVDEVRVEYPTTPGKIPIVVPSGYLQLRVGLTVETPGGVVRATLTDADGRALASAQVLAKGADGERASARPKSAVTWTLDHQGVGSGVVHLEITGIAATGPLSDQSSRAAWPQEGQTSWMGLVLGA